jgi:hypothetical protein
LSQCVFSVRRSLIYVYFLDLAIYVFVCARVFARCILQRLVEARLRAVFCRAHLQHLEMGAGKWRAQSV